MTDVVERDLVWALTPCGRPDPAVVAAAGRSGALGVVDLGTEPRLDDEAIAAVLAETARLIRVPFAVRVSPEGTIRAEQLPDGVDTVIVAGGGAGALAAWSIGRRRVVAEVASVDEALAASASGAAGVLVTAAAVDDLEAIVDAVAGDVRVWVMVPAPVDPAERDAVGRLLDAGVAGVVISGELALLRESTLSLPARAALLRDPAAGGRARSAATRWRTVGRAVNEVRAVVTDHRTQHDPAGAVPVEAEPTPVDVAIVGMACVVPGAADVATFWSHIVDGVCSISEVPPERWDVGRYYDGDFDAATLATESPKSVSKWGGFVPDVEFDALAWGIPPKALAAIDPAQLLALKAASDALDDAGYGRASGSGDGVDHERTSVVYATGSGGAADVSAGFLLRMLLPNFMGELPPELDEWLPRLSEDATPGILTSVIAGRVANRLDLGGKNLTVDAACASVLAALDIACKELLAGGSDIVLCGGVDLHNAQQDYMIFTAAQALSKSGECRSFSADADGMTLGEGAGCLVLKRLADAERDGDRIYSVIKGIGGSSDGRHLGLTAPRQEGQELSLRRAYGQCGISPRDVGLIEAHGTGTTAGDRIELGTLTEVYREAEVGPGSVVLGSVKSNIGHIKCAAGVAGLIKAAKSLYHGVLPPTLHLTRPNDVWDGATSPFRFLAVAQPWLDERRVAAVSAFGFGGTNFHAILENYADAPLPLVGRDQLPAELLAFHGTTDEIDRGLDELVDRLGAELTWPVPVTRFALRDIAASVTAAPADGPPGLTIVATDLADLQAKAASARRRDDRSGVHWARPLDAEAVGVALAPDAIVDLLVAFPVARAVLVEDRVVADALLAPMAFDADTRAEQRRALAVPEVAARVAALTTEALAAVLAPFGVTAQGSSSGGLITIGTEHGETHAVTALLDALARLAVTGVPVELSSLFEGRDVDPARWNDPRDRARWIVNGFLVRNADGEPLRHGLRPMNGAPRIERGELVPPPGAAGMNDQVLLEYLRSTNELITTGVDIIRHVSSLDPPIGLPARVATPMVPMAPPPAASVTAAPAPEDGTAAARALLARPEVLLERLIAIVSARTGYPADMLDPDLDVEADLSIDSIKRIEILGELAEDIGLGGERGQMDQLESLVEELAMRKTLRSIVDWLIEQGDVLLGGAVAAAAT